MILNLSGESRGFKYTRYGLCQPLRFSSPVIRLPTHLIFQQKIIEILYDCEKHSVSRGTRGAYGYGIDSKGGSVGVMKLRSYIQGLG